MEKKKIKIIKIVLIIVGIILLVFLVRTTRNMIILKKIDNAVSKYQNANNVHITSYTYYGDGLNIKESYQKDDKYIVKVNVDSKNHKRMVINYCDGKNINSYIESDGDKVAILSSNGKISVQPETFENYSENSRLLDLLLMSCRISIKSEVCNGKECYKLSLSNMVASDNEDLSKIESSIYFDKETGLIVREMDGTSGEGKDEFNTVKDMKYEFDKVTDADIVEPDISGYTIQENYIF